MSKTWTILKLLETTEEFLRKHGSDSPRLDAELMLADVLDVSRTRLYMDYAKPLSQDELAAYRELVRRRSKGEPVAYIVGTRGFWSLDLVVDVRVLIPRPETELLVEHALRHVGEERDRAWKIVDVGTGSGAIAIALATELPEANVVAIDRSADALDVARANAARHEVTERVFFLEGDLLAPLIRRGSSAEIIVSNPPYVSAAEYDALPRDVRDFEPASALVSGPEGLDAIEQLIARAPDVLTDDGVLLVEIGAGQGDAVRALAGAEFGEVEIHQDLAGRDRILEARRSG